jgi:predicted nucleic acid-binding protein
MRPEPAAQVLAWLDAQDAQQVWISSITCAEIALGLALLPDGQKKQGLQAAAQAMIDIDFAQRCLSFDPPAALMYGDIVAKRTKMGRPISAEDAQIAAIAMSRGLRLATRNVKDFEHLDLQLLNPWDA